MGTSSDHEAGSAGPVNDIVETDDLPAPGAVAEYIRDTQVAWGIHSENAIFKLKIVPLEWLEDAEERPLSLATVDLSMAGRSRTKGPIVLDADFSIIDGMHRLADAVLAERESIEAYVRM